MLSLVARHTMEVTTRAVTARIIQNGNGRANFLGRTIRLLSSAESNNSGRVPASLPFYLQAADRLPKPSSLSNGTAAEVCVTFHASDSKGMNEQYKFGECQEIMDFLSTEKESAKYKEAAFFGNLGVMFQNKSKGSIVEIRCIVDHMVQRDVVLMKNLKNKWLYAKEAFINENVKKITDEIVQALISYSKKFSQLPAVKA